jgi:catechol 2,3-dioxygenase-like lactoylglutathione lyase family enzyme
MAQTLTDTSSAAQTKAQEAESATKVSALRRLHHHAFPVADQEVTRQFMEDILGVPLKATWSERSERGAADPETEAMPKEWKVTSGGTNFVHTFYELADGGAIAFFQFDGSDQHLVGRTNIYYHLALETNQAGQDAIHQRLLDRGIQHHIINHGYVTSLYVTSPDGLLFEVCVDPEFVDEIREIRSASAHDDLKRWMSGDYTLNNQWRGTAPQIFEGRSLYDAPTS